MLKFQNNHTTTIVTFEDFMVTVYVIIDDLYHPFAPPDVINGRHVSDAKMSDSEIITISICGELGGIDSENAWSSFVKRNYRQLFPKLCSRNILWLIVSHLRAVNSCGHGTVIPFRVAVRILESALLRRKHTLAIKYLL